MFFFLWKNPFFRIPYKLEENKWKILMFDLYQLLVQNSADLT